MEKKTNKKDIHKGHRQRIKDKYIKNGLDFFDDHEILELLLFYCYPRIDTNELAHNFIDEFGSLSNLFDAHPLDIVRRCDVTENVAVLISLIPGLCKRYNLIKWDKKEILNTSEKMGNFVKNLFTGKNNECFFLICLDNQRRLNQAVKISEGTVNQTSVFTRVIVDVCLKYHATSVVLAHNHPSGALIASYDDINATKKIKAALETIDVDVLDHFIIAGDNYLSFAEKKLLK